MSHPRVLRVGALVVGDRLPAADGQLLEQLLSTDYLKLAIIAVVRPRTFPGDGSMSARALVSLYRWMDRKTIGGGEAEAARLLASCTAGQTHETLLFENADEKLTTTLMAHGLDVIVCLSPFEGMRNCSAAAKFGVWWTGFAPTETKGAEFINSLFAAAAAEPPLSYFLWASSAPQAEPLCLEDGLVPFVSSISVAKNLRGLRLLRRNLWLSALRRLALQGWEAVCERGARLQAIAIQRRKSLLKPKEVTATAVAHALVHMGMRQLRHRSRQRDRVEQWQVGLRPMRDRGQALCDTKGYRWLRAPAGHWYADPFLWSAGEKDLLYMEEFSETRKKGRIVCGTVDARGRVSAVQPVLERPYHMAYPCVFEHDGELFMIPETGFNNTVELYRSISLPLQWELVRVLYTGPAFDTSVLHHEGRLWFFTSLVEDEARHTSQLLLFHSDRVDGDWIWHPANPISNDARVARSGGGILRHGARIIRPAQDGGNTYGGAVNLRQIEILNESEYTETPFGSITPARLPNAVGLHTYNRCARMEAIDCRLRLLHRG